MENLQKGNEESTPMKTLNNSSSEEEENALKIDLEPDSDSLHFSESLPQRIRSYSRWSPIEEGVTLAWNDVTVYSKYRENGLPKCKRIINSATGAVRAGSLVALMGASGAGKSSLMAALANRLPAKVVCEGDILINGRKIGNYMKYLSGYMHQDDLFVEFLTVKEHMNIMARLKLDRRTTAEDREKKIQELLRNLGLMKCYNTRINGISGGEKKRVAFATELLTDPPLLFCDEPTTGLDSYSAQKLVKMMNTMAAGGKTIVCTIHQPSSDVFRMFSQLILLADGRIAYIGNVANAIDFFNGLGYKCPESFNPADFFIRTLACAPGQEENSRLAIKKICDNYVVSDYAKEMDVILQYEFHMERAGCLPKDIKIKNNFKEMYWWSKLFWLTRRWFLEILRNPKLQILNIIQKIFIAVLVGFCYLGTDATTQTGVQSVQGAVFLLVSENTFHGMYSVLAEFCEQRPLFFREYQAGLYHPLIYYISRILSILPGLIIDPVIFVVIVYWMSGLKATAYAFLMSVLIATITLNVATACGVFFSNAFSTVPIAMAYLVPFDYILFISSGVFIKISTLPSYFHWTKYISWFMYSVESLTIIQWTGVNDISCDPNPNIPCLRNSADIFAKYGFAESHLTWDVVAMIFIAFVFYILGYVCLVLRLRK